MPSVGNFFPPGVDATNITGTLDNNTLPQTIEIESFTANSISIGGDITIAGNSVEQRLIDFETRLVALETANV